MGRNEKQAAKHANNSKGEKLNTSKHVAHKPTGIEASRHASRPTKQTKRAKHAKQANHANAGDKQNKQIAYHSVLERATK